MARVDTTQLDLFNAIVAHVRTTLAIDDSRVFLVIEPLSMRVPQGSDWWITIAPGAGNFDQEVETGGVVEQGLEDSEFTATAYLRMHLDQVNHDDKVLLDATAGLLELKRKLINAIAGLDLLVGANPVLRELIMPRSSSAPALVQTVSGDGQDEGLRIGVISVVFSLVWDWNIA